MDELSAWRRADRAEMAQAVCYLLGEYKQLVGTLRPEQAESRKTSVDVEGPHGLRLTVWFDGSLRGTGPDTYVLSWYGVEEGTRLHPGMFNSVNSFHGRKATDVARGFAQLERILRERFTVICDGSAFVGAP